MLARISSGVYRNVAENQTLMSPLFIKDQYVLSTLDTFSFFFELRLSLINKKKKEEITSLMIGYGLRA